MHCCMAWFRHTKLVPVSDTWYLFTGHVEQNFSIHCESSAFWHYLSSTSLCFKPFVSQENASKHFKAMFSCFFLLPWVLDWMLLLLGPELRPRGPIYVNLPRPIACDPTGKLGRQEPGRTCASASSLFKGHLGGPKDSGPNKTAWSF